MTAMSAPEPMTAQECLALPAQEHRSSELVGGEIVVDPPSLQPGLAPKLDAVSAE
jgi:hypothetical protein